MHTFLFMKKLFLYFWGQFTGKWPPSEFQQQDILSGLCLNNVGHHFPHPLQMGAAFSGAQVERSWHLGIELPSQECVLPVLFIAS